MWINNLIYIFLIILLNHIKDYKFINQKFI